MKRIAQKSIELADSGIACVAMAAQCSYDQAKAVMAKVEKHGQFHAEQKDITKALKALNIKYQVKAFTRLRNIEGIAIVATNKKLTGEFHWVVYDGTAKEPHVLDPKPHKKAKVTDFRGLLPFGHYILIK